MIIEQNDDNLPWVEKYRPKQLNEVLSNTHVISTLQNFL